MDFQRLYLMPFLYYNSGLTSENPVAQTNNPKTSRGQAAEEGSKLKATLCDSDPLFQYIQHLPCYLIKKALGKPQSSSWLLPHFIFPGNGISQPWEVHYSST